MKNARWTTVAALAACLLPLVWLETGAALAQQGRGADSRSEPELPIRDRLIDLQFPGGTVDEYINAVRDVTRSADLPEGLNVVIDNPQAASREHLPAISLKRVRVDTAMELIANVATSREYRVQARDLNPRGDPVYVLNSRELSASPDRPKSISRRIEVFSIRDLAATGSRTSGDDAGRFEIQTILTALETALSMSESPVTKDQMRYHPESGLLFLYGTDEQISVVQRTLDRMKGRDVSAGGEDAYRYYSKGFDSYGEAAGAAQQGQPGASRYSYYYQRAKEQPEPQQEDAGAADRRSFYWSYRAPKPGTAATQAPRTYGVGGQNAATSSQAPATESRHLEQALAAAQQEIAVLKQQLRELKAAVETTKSGQPAGENTPR